MASYEIAPLISGAFKQRCQIIIPADFEKCSSTHSYLFGATADSGDGLTTKAGFSIILLLGTLPTNQGESAAIERLCQSALISLIPMRISRAKHV